MATAWELLIEHSTLPADSTAWEHLNAQEGGSGDCPIRYVSDKSFRFSVNKFGYEFKKINGTLFFSQEKHTFDFTKRNKAITIKQKEMKITFIAKKVIS